MILGFIRSLANTFTYHPHMNLQQANDRMQQMGWGDFELDYFTYRLAVECLEACGLNKSEYKSAQWFENNFTLNNTDLINIPGVLLYEQTGSNRRPKK